MERESPFFPDKLGSERKLRHIDIEVTKKCNLFCVHCSSQSNKTGRELSLGEIKTVLEKASLLGLQNVGFTGGEPLLRRNKLVTLLKYCKRVLNIKTHLHTNGTLLKSKDAAIMTRFVDETTVAFYGSKPKTHDGITRISGSLKATMEGLCNLVHQDSFVRTFIVPMKSNFKEIPQIVKKVHETGCDKIRILSLSPTGRARNNFADLSLNLDDIKWLIDELIVIQNELGVNIDAGFCTRQDYPQLNELQGHQSCFAAENRVHIDAFGEVFPCTASSGWELFSAGNLRKYAFNLSGIWNFSPIFQFFRFFHSNPPHKCQGCTIYQQCMSGCRVMMYYKYGDVTVPNPKCRSPSSFPSSPSEEKQI